MRESSLVDEKGLVWERSLIWERDLTQKSVLLSDRSLV